VARAATIVDVAREAECSINTVSRALNSMPGVSRETRDRVVAAAERLGYIPNRLARSLHRRTSRMLGLIVTDCTDPFYARLIRAVEDTAAEEGYGVILCNSAEADEREARAIKLMLESRVDGLLITPVQGASSHIELLKSIPFVLLGRRFAQLETSYVSTDNEVGAYQATAHLLSLGHRRVAHVTGRPEISSVAERTEGFSRALKELGLEGQVIFGLDRDLQGGQLAAQQLLTAANPPTAVFVYNDLMALGILHTARDLGVKIPEELSVVGFDNIELAAYFDVPLTTVAQPIAEIGCQGTTALLKLLDGSGPAGIQRLLPPQLIVRASTAVRAGSASEGSGLALGG
jgi:LacI family transcriptional regulator